MNKILLLPMLTAAMLSSATILAQNTYSSDRPNEITVGYGAFSVFYFQNNNHFYPQPYDSYYYDESDPSSPGTFFFGYHRQISKILWVGTTFAYQHRTSTLMTSEYNYYDTLYTGGTSEDHLITGMTKVTFSYINKPVLKLYSAFALGITVDFNSMTEEGTETNDKRIIPAAQLTLFGIRAGKALGGFFEIGAGSNGIMVAGISYRFND